MEADKEKENENDIKERREKLGKYKVGKVGKVERLKKEETMREDRNHSTNRLTDRLAKK